MADYPYVCGFCCTGQCAECVRRGLAPPCTCNVPQHHAAVAAATIPAPRPADNEAVQTS